MNISVVDIGIAQSTSGTTLSIIVPPGGVPAGSLICLAAAQDGTITSAGTSTDSKGNSYLKKVTSVNSGNNAYGWGAFFIVWNSIALVSGDTITYNKFSGGTQATAISAFYATGIQTFSDPTNLIVGPVMGNGNATISGTPAAGDLAVVLCILNPRSNIDVLTVTSPAWIVPFSVSTITSGAQAGAEGLNGGHLISDGSSTTYSQTLSNASARHSLTWMLSFKPQSQQQSFNHPFPT